MEFTLDISEIREALEKGVKKLASDVAHAVEPGLRHGADVARSTARFSDRSGTARSKIEGVVETITANGAAGVLVCDVPYASYLNDGTAPHEIRPRAGKGFVGPLRSGQKRGRRKARAFLSWVGSDGERHFARVVHHPGTKPDGFMERGAAAAEEHILASIEEAAREFERALR